MLSHSQRKQRVYPVGTAARLGLQVRSYEPIRARGSELLHDAEKRLKYGHGALHILVSVEPRLVEDEIDKLFF